MMTMNLKNVPWMLVLLGLLGFSTVACTGDNPCFGSTAAQCGPPTMSGTPTPTTCNGETGIDLSSDPMHCGSCEKACLGTETCNAGECSAKVKVGDNCSCSAAGIATNVGTCLPIDGSAIKVAYRGANNERYPVLPPETRCTIQQPDTWATTLNAGEDAWNTFQSLPAKAESGFTFRTSAGKISLVKVLHNQIFALDPAKDAFKSGTWFIWGQSSDGTPIQGELCRSIRNASDCVVP